MANETLDRPGVELAKALAKAQDEMKPVGKDGRSYFKMKNGNTVDYKYASTEHLIIKAKECLHSNGLSFYREHYSFSDGVGDAPCIISVVFALRHESGECVRMNAQWPVVPGPGRPMDKATGAALTSCLGYALRDVLLIPRSDEPETMDCRDDGGYEPGHSSGQHNGRREVPKVPTGRELFQSAAMDTTGLMGNDLNAFCRDACTRLGITGKSTAEQWAAATEELKTHAGDWRAWVSNGTAGDGGEGAE